MVGRHNILAIWHRVSILYAGCFTMRVDFVKMHEPNHLLSSTSVVEAFHWDSLHKARLHFCAFGYGFVEHTLSNVRFLYTQLSHKCQRWGTYWTNYKSHYVRER